MDPNLANVVTGAADTLTQLLLRPENLYLMIATYAVINTARKVLRDAWAEHHIVVRLAPLFPLVLCSAGVWIPGQQPADMSAGSKVLVGLVLGWACGNLYKVWAQTIRGKDARIAAHRVRAKIKVINGTVESP